MNPVRVVIADDHAVVRDGIANTIKGLPGLQIVAEVGNGAALFATLAQVQPDCLLLDIAMPGFLAISDIHLIRSRYPDMKILVITAYDEDIYVQGMLTAGVHGYHLKDQPLDDLRLAVQRVLSGERWVCSPLVEKLLHSRETSSTGPTLTARQSELLRYLKQGLDNHAIARQAFLSVKTIENHLTRLYRQLKVQSRLEAVAYVTQHPEVLGKAETNPVSYGSNSSLGMQALDILLVDDNQKNRAQLHRLLSKAAAQASIYEVENAQGVIDLLKDIHPHIAFIDVVLGNETGIVCTRVIREHCQATRVVLLSAYPDWLFHQRGLEAGAVACLDKKELNVAMLREVINDVIE